MDNLKKIGLLLLVVVVFGGGYTLAQTLRPEGLIVTTFLDNSIPFVDFFVVFYIAYFPLLIVPVLLYWSDYREYKKMMSAFLIVIVVSVAVYLAFQTEVTRPHIEGTNVFRQLILMFYGNDRPVNSLPSLHVSLSALAAFFVHSKSRKLGLIITPLAVLVMFSTVFIKQHAVLDVFGGLALAVVVFKWRLRPRQKSKKGKSLQKKFLKL